jgi:hypothetical protein
VAQGEPLVSIPAQTSPFDSEAGGGQYTFYTALEGAAGGDSRRPLVTNFAARYQNRAASRQGPGSVTDLVVWRDPKVVQKPFDCGTLPDWYPLSQEKLVAFDEAEQATVLPGLTPFGAATQKVRLGGAALPVPYDAGWLFLNLNTTVDGVSIPAEDPAAAQAWVVVLEERSGGRASVGRRAIPLDHATSANHQDPDE